MWSKMTVFPTRDTNYDFIYYLNAIQLKNKGIQYYRLKKIETV